MATENKATKFGTELAGQLHEFRQRLEAIDNSGEIKFGLETVSLVGQIAEQVLFTNNIPHVWFPPLDTSIHEYDAIDFVVTNPLNGLRYSLIQSPQIMKEAAAIVFGSNWRQTTCYRPEPGDATHAQMFQQVDVELRDGDGKQARKLAGEILSACSRRILGVDINPIPELDYLDTIDKYGSDQPNLHKSLSKGKPVSAYWLINMPYLTERNGLVSPLHHVMTMPYEAINNSGFSFNNYSPQELCVLRCDSYDLVICTDEEVIEIAGGDRRIDTASLQIEAINKLGLPIKQFAFLLEALELNEAKQPPRSLAGFAFGLERVAMTLGGLHNLDKVQIYPVNKRDGGLIHAYGLKLD